MQVEVNQDTFPSEHLFLITGRVAGEQAPPVQPVGVFIAKQTVQLDGTLDPQQQEKILLKDEEYPQPEPPPDPPPLRMYLESDLVPTKPNLDLVVIRDSSQPGNFGRVRIKRNGIFDSFRNLDYGWRSRLEGERQEQVGDIASFQPIEIPDPANPPSLEERLKLPSGFRNLFFNGSRLIDIPPLQSNQVVEFRNDTTNNLVEVTIPTAPQLAITIDDQPISPSVPIELSVDTVIYNLDAQHFLLTWRAVFPWSEQLAAATLEVS